MAEHLTDKIVRELPAPGTGNRLFYDTEVTGFACRVTAGHAKSFVLNYRAGRRERRYTIGSFPDWTTGQAREEARNLKRRIDLGEDPMAERHAERSAPTINDLADRFEAKHLPRLRPATVRDYKAMLAQFIRPALGKLKVVDVRYADIDRLHRQITKHAPYRANRVIALLSKMLALAIRWEIRPDNPAHGIERAPEEKRERFLMPAEIGRLAGVLATHPERTSANAVRLLLLTGARKGELLAARWEDFDLDAGVWVKPSAHTKQKKSHRVPLSVLALTLLAEMKAKSDKENERRVRDKLQPIPHVFPSVDGRSLGDIKRFWAAVCRKAGLIEVRVHDLRHTHAAILASAGLSLPVIGALLGHTQPSTTARYAHLLDDPLRKAAETAGAIITGQSPAEVMELPKGRRA